MVTASPPVSPNVVARIFMIQKPSVTAGTLLNTSDVLSVIGQPSEKSNERISDCAGSALMFARRPVFHGDGLGPGIQERKPHRAGLGGKAGPSGIAFVLRHVRRHQEDAPAFGVDC